MYRAVSSGSWVISDEWAATGPAVAAAGLNLEGQVCHESTFRNPESGIHSNDIESEFARFKMWVLKKWAFYRMPNCQSEEAKRDNLSRRMTEYIFYTSVGRKMTDVMTAVLHHVSCTP